MNEIDEILKFDPERKEAKTKSDGSNGSVVDDILKFDPEKSSKPAMDTEAKKKDQEDSLTWKQALVEGISNFPSSTGRYVGNMARGAANIPKMGTDFGKILSGGVGKLIEGEQPNEEAFDSFVGMFKDQYGSIENFKKTLAKDPATVLGDISMVFSGLGSAAKATGTIAGMSKVKRVGDLALKAGMKVEPINVARAIAAAPLKLMPEKIPVNMYQSAVKFGTTLSAKERIAVTRTALKAENQIMPTERGMARLRNKIDVFNDRVNLLINRSAESGAKLDANKLFNGIEDVKNLFKRISDEPLVWDREFSKIKKQWEEVINISDVRTPAEIQKIKTRIYKDLESFYEKQKAAPAKVELRKAVARNARGMIEDIIPEVKQLNQKEGELIALWDAIESKANRITNRDIISIGMPMKMGTGAGIGYMFGNEAGGKLGTAIGFGLGLFDTPQIKAKIALVLSRLKEKGIMLKPTSTATKLGLYQYGKYIEEGKKTGKGYRIIEGEN